MTSVIVLYAKETGPVVGVLATVGAAPVPTLPAGRTFRLPVGTTPMYVTFRSEELSAAAVETSVTDPLALFGYGVRPRAQVAPGPPEVELVQLVTGAIHIDTPPDPTPREGGLIKGTVQTGNAAGTLDLELWNAGGRVGAIRVPCGTPTAFRFPPVEPGNYVVLAPGFEPAAVTVPDRAVL